MTDVQCTVAELIAHRVAERGVSIAFGIPGVHNLPLWHALQRAGIRTVLSRHEQGAAYAADGYYRATGELGVCVTTSGPGAANAAGAAGEALTSGSAVLHLTTSSAQALRHPDETVRRGALHELPFQADIFRPLSKSCWVLRDPEVADDLVQSAIHDALSAPTGPVYLECPVDVLGMPASRRSPAPTDVDERPAGTPQLDGPTAQAIEEAESIVIWCGNGARDADVSALADHLAAPVVTTLMGRSVVPSDHPLVVNAPPHEPAVSGLVENAALVIALGTDFDGQTTQNWKMRMGRTLIRVDIDPGRAQVNYVPDFVVTSSVEDFIRGVQAQVGAADQVRLQASRSTVESVQQAVAARLGLDELDVAAIEVIRTLGEVVPATVPVVADMTLVGYWASGYLRRNAPRSFMFPMGWGTLGFGLPTSVGVSHAVGATVVLMGDAGMMFGLGELAAIAEHRLPVVIVVFNDEAYAMLAHGLDATSAGGMRGLFTPDFVALAGAFDIAARRVSLAELGGAVQEALASGGPVLIETSNVQLPPITTGARWPTVTGS